MKRKASAALGAILRGSRSGRVLEEELVDAQVHARHEFDQGEEPHRRHHHAGDLRDQAGPRARSPGRQRPGGQARRDEAQRRVGLHGNGAGHPRAQEGKSRAQPTRMAGPRTAVASAAARASVSRFLGSRRESTDMGAAGHVDPLSLRAQANGLGGRRRMDRDGPVLPCPSEACMKSRPRHPAEALPRAIRGYDPEEVEAFLSLAASAFEDLVKELHSLREELRARTRRSPPTADSSVRCRRPSSPPRGRARDPGVGPQGGRDHHRRGRAPGGEDRPGRTPALPADRRRHPGDEAAAGPVRGLGRAWSRGTASCSTRSATPTPGIRSSTWPAARRGTGSNRPGSETLASSEAPF